MKKRIFAMAMILMSLVLILSLASCNEGDGGETTPKDPSNNVQNGGNDGGNNNDNNDNNGNDNNGNNNNNNDNNGGETHVHAYGEWETVKAPTCKESGERLRSCECGDKQSETLDRLSHVESDWITETAATATEKGTRYKKCTLCGDRIVTEELPATGSLGLSYEKNSENTYTITGIGTCTETEIYIPEYIDGGKITAIDDGAFKGNTTITSVSIPGIYYVGESAFEGCTALAEVKIGYGTEYIGASAFMNCTSLVSIELPTSLEKISEYMLSGCERLERLDIPSGVTSIDNYALGGLKKLSYLSFPASIKTVGKSVFSVVYYYPLTELYIEDIAAFCALDFNNTNEGYGGDRAYCNPFALFSMADGKLYVGGKLITAEDTLVIPEGVTRIGQCVFERYPYSKISIPNSIKYIDVEAFEGFINYTRLTFNEYDNAYYLGNAENPYAALIEVKDSSITSCTIHPDTKAIADMAFANCSNLTSIVIPEGVNAIGSRAFYCCTNLSSLTVSDPNTEIAEDAFAGCTSLPKDKDPEPVYTEYGGAYYQAVGDNPYAILVKAMDSAYSISIHPDTKIISDDALSKHYVATISNDKTSDLYNKIIPDGVTYIGERAFYDCSFYHRSDTEYTLVIPDSVTHIGDEAFRGNDFLNVVLSKNITSIGDGVFSGCYKLQSISIPEGVTSIGNSAFSGCTLLTKIAIPDNVKSIGERAFYACEGLTEIVIPDSVKSIGSYAFSSCASVISVTLGRGVENVERYAFSECTNITEVYNRSSLNVIRGTLVHGGVAEYAKKVIVDENESSRIVYQDDFILYDGKDAVYVIKYSGNATEVTLPELVNGKKVENYIIGRYAFYRKSNITSISLPECVTEIEEYAFYECSKLASINLHDGIKEIGEYAFYNCRGLTEIVIPAGVKQIKDFTFYNCSKLCKVTLPEGMTEIGSYAFYECSSLETLIIPDSVTAIGGRAFYGCKSIISVTLGKRLVTIGYRAFSECSLITEIYNRSDLTVICGTLDNGGVAEYAKNVYTDDVGRQKLFFENGYLIYDDDDAAYVIKYEGDATEIALPETINGRTVEKYIIGESAFEGNKTLKSIILPVTVVEIESRAFYGCSGLNKIVIPNGVTKIGTSAFFGCTSATELVIPESVAEIGGSAFRNCTSLNKLVIPNGVAQIGSYAFYGCSSVTELVLPESITEISAYAFGNCSSVKKIVVPSGVTKIGEAAFANCSTETVIILPATVTEIEMNVFGDRAINEFVFEGTVEQWQAIEKSEYWTNRNYTIICTNGTVNAK